MGLIQALQGFVQAIDKAYERRIRAASLVREYHVGGHGHTEDHAHVHETAQEIHHEQEVPAQTHSGEVIEEAAMPARSQH